MPLNYLVNKGAICPFSFSIEGMQGIGIVYMNDLDSFLRPKCVVKELVYFEFDGMDVICRPFDKSAIYLTDLYMLFWRHLTWFCEERGWVLWDL